MAADPRNTRLLRLYGKTAAECDGMLEEQGGGCAVCRKPAKTIRLSVDHDHKVERFKVEASKLGTRWYAWAFPFPKKDTKFEAEAPKRSAAVREVKRLLKRASVRGILCSWCNRGLRYYHDNPELLRNAAQYLERHQNG